MGKKLKSIVLKDDEGKTEKIDVDVILGFFGLIMQLDLLQSGD